MNRAHPMRPHANRSFTLAEILVAMAVALLLFSMLAQVVSLVSRALHDDWKRMDAWDQARSVFDRVGFDWNGRGRSSQIPSFVVKPVSGTGNDIFVMVSAVPSTTGNRVFSAVQYEIDATDASDARTTALQRGSLGFSFINPSAPVSDGSLTNLFEPAGFFSSSDNPAPFTFPSTPVADLFQPLGDEVFAVSTAFLTSGYTNTVGNWVPPGIYALPPNLSVNPSWPTTTNPWPSTSISAGMNVVDLTSTNIVAMVVSVAVLDKASRSLMTPSQFSDLAALFAYPTTSTNTPVVYWQKNVLTDGFYLNTPKSAYQAVKVYQRFYYAQ